jgi:hypothetical protein
MKTRVIVLACLCLTLLSSIAVANEFAIKISVVSSEGSKGSTGSGRIVTTDKEFGRISVAFYGDKGNFVVHTIGTNQFPIGYLNNDGDTKLEIGELVGVAEFVLRPSVTNEKKIKLKGVVNKFIRTDLYDPNSFAYSEDKIDLILPKNGHKYEFYIGNRERFVTLNIEATALDDVVYEKKIYRHITYNCRYELRNEKTGEKRAQAKCELGMDANSDGHGSCSNRNLFQLTNGDSLLYIPVIEIRETQWNDDGTISFTFEFSRIYALNPEDTSPSAQEIRSDKTLMNVLEKRVIAKPDETTVIRITPDPQSQLPFTATEIVKIDYDLKVNRE